MNREHLKRLMKKHSWTMEDVAKIADSSIHSVRAWLRPNTSLASRTMRADTASVVKLASEALGKTSKRKPASALEQAQI